MNELFTIFTLINDIECNQADAVILLEGDGLSRIADACNLVLEGFAPILVFSGGIDNESNGSFTYEKCKSEIDKYNLKPDQLMLELDSKHTRDQAEKIIAMCKVNKWTKIILVASNFHIYRAFLTFVKVLEEEKLMKEIDVFIKSVHLSWFEQLNWGKRIEMFKSEVSKIKEYQTKGHIPNYDVIIEYFKWKEDQLK